MALIDFTKIPQSTMVPGESTPIMRVYDPLWGFVSVQQAIEFRYERESKYRTFGTVTIKGVFTLHSAFIEENGEGVGEGVLPSGQTPGNQWPDHSMDDERFNLLKAKYDNLRSVFVNAGLKSAPDNLEDYGTFADTRCIILPSGLVDFEGNPVYMRPVSLAIEETQWPNLIKYNATMKEVPPLPCKMTLNGRIIDKGTVTINARKPSLRLQEYAFANSVDVFFGGWESRTYSFSGSLPEIVPSGMIVPPSGARDFLNSLMEGRVTMGKTIAFPGGNPPPGADGRDYDVIKDLFVDSSTVSFVQDNDGKGIRFNLSAKE